MAPKQKAILGRPLHRIAERDRRPGFGRGPLQGQGPEVAAIIATRTALRVASLNFRDARKARGAKEVSAFLVLTSAAFRASALARVAAKYPTRANRLNAAALIAAARASAAAVVGDSSDAADGWAILGAASALAAAADASDAASASILAAPGFAAAADVAPTAIRLAAHADASFLAAYAAADPDLRAEIRFDSAAAAKLGAPRLADLRLWSRGPADWVEGAWDGLRLALPRGSSETPASPSTGALHPDPRGPGTRGAESANLGAPTWPPRRCRSEFPPGGCRIGAHSGEKEASAWAARR